MLNLSRTEERQKLLDFQSKRSVTAAAAMVIVILALKYASDFVAPIFLATTLAILFTPTLRWLEKKGLHTGLALLVMVLGLGGFSSS